MSNFDGLIDPAADWADVPQLSTDADAIGGAGGPMNAQAVALVKRIKYLDENKASNAATEDAQAAADAAQATADAAALEVAETRALAESVSGVASDAQAAAADAQLHAINAENVANAATARIMTFSHKNKLINGDFRVNQRAYVSGAAVGSGLYGHDRWKMAASGDTYTFSTADNKTTITIPAGKVLRQVVEGINLQTGTYVLSWEGTAQGKIGAGSPSGSGVTAAITGGVDTTIEFGPGTVANVQLELGTVATPFEQIGIAESTKSCQRYYEKGRARLDSYAAASGQGCGFHVNYKVSKRTNSNPVYSYDAGFINVSGGGATYSSTNEGFIFTDTALAAGIVRVTGQWIKNDEI